MDWTNADERQKVLDQAIDGIGGAMDGEEWTLDEDKILQVKRLGTTRTAYLQNDLMPNEPDLPGAIGYRAIQMRKSISLIADTLRAGKPADDDDDDLWRHVVHTLNPMRDHGPHETAHEPSVTIDAKQLFEDLQRAERNTRLNDALPYNRYNWRENELRDTLPDCWKSIPIEGQYGVANSGIVEVSKHYRRKLIAIGLL